jgi:hypothetical protein
MFNLCILSSNLSEGLPIHILVSALFVSSAPPAVRCNTLQTQIISGITPCTMLEVNRHVKGTPPAFTLVSCLAYSLTLILKALFL